MATVWPPFPKPPFSYKEVVESPTECRFINAAWTHFRGHIPVNHLPTILKGSRSLLPRTFPRHLKSRASTLNTLKSTIDSQHYLTGKSSTVIASKRTTITGALRLSTNTLHPSKHAFDHSQIRIHYARKQKVITRLGARDTVAGRGKAQGNSDAPVLQRCTPRDIYASLQKAQVDIVGSPAACKDRIV